MKTLRTIYKVKIQKIETIERNTQSWKKVADTGNEKDDGAQYAYVDSKDTEEETTDILIQEKESVDIEAIIKAINNL